jgi:signal transduction histidine kinase
VELTDYGLLSALKDLATRVSKQFNISCGFENAGQPMRFAKNSEIHVYRIVQESITNAIKHGHARKIRVRYKDVRGTNVISVTNDGARFVPPGSQQIGPGMGLHLMKYRARLLGARLDFECPKAGGCKVTFSVAGKSPRQSKVAKKAMPASRPRRVS